MIKCLRCKKTLRRHHKNRKRCEPCAKFLRKKPQGHMTRQQITKARAMLHKVPRDEIANRLGVSVSNLKRSMPGVSFWYFNRYAANPDLVESVCKYYEKHGKAKTEKKFPEVNLRSIVERYKKFKPRQVRWSNKEKIELAKMAGLISFSDQAKYFRRPNANAGSIRSIYAKSIKLKGGELNGMTHHQGRNIVSPDCPFVTRRLASRTGRRTKSPLQKIALWVDMEKYLLKNIPDVIAQPIRDLAQYQRWLFGATSNAHAKLKIMRMIKERTSDGVSP